MQKNSRAIFLVDFLEALTMLIADDVKQKNIDSRNNRLYIQFFFLIIGRPNECKPIQFLMSPGTGLCMVVNTTETVIFHNEVKLTLTI